MARATCSICPKIGIHLPVDLLYETVDFTEEQDAASAK